MPQPDYNAESVATFDRHAAAYAAKYFDQPQYEPHYERLAAALPVGGGRFLDLACGPGNVAAHVRRRHPQAEIWGVDGAPNMLAQARERVPGLHALCADCRDLSELAAPFDGAAFFFGLSYFDDADARRVLAALHGLLRPQAPLLLATLTGGPRRQRLQHRQRRRPGLHRLPPPGGGGGAAGGSRLRGAQPERTAQPGAGHGANPGCGAVRPARL